MLREKRNKKKFKFDEAIIEIYKRIITCLNFECYYWFIHGIDSSVMLWQKASLSGCFILGYYSTVEFVAEVYRLHNTVEMNKNKGKSILNRPNHRNAQHDDYLQYFPFFDV